MKGCLRKLEYKIRKKIYFKSEEKKFQKKDTGTGKKFSTDYTWKIIFLASWSQMEPVGVKRIFFQFMRNLQSDGDIPIEMVGKNRTNQSTITSIWKTIHRGGKKCPRNVFPKSIYGNLSKLQEFGYSVQWHTMLQTLTHCIWIRMKWYFFRCASLNTHQTLPLSNSFSLASSVSFFLPRSLVIFQIKCETANC